MRRAISFLLVSIFLTAGIPLASAQKRKPKHADTVPAESAAARTAKQNRNANKTEFASVRAHEQDGGVWVHWQMEAEYDNYGFYVYKINGSGRTRISEMEIGSAFKQGNAPLFGENYSFFDAYGTAADTYFVEARTSKGVVKTGTITVEAGEDNHDGEAPPVRNEALARPVTNELVLPQELSAEVNAGLLPANPTRHTQVISQPGVKIKSKASGLTRVTRAQLVAAGFDVNSDPSKWQLYLEGNELPIIVGPNGDFIEFLGKALDTIESDTRTYYLINGTSAGKRVYVTPMQQGRARAVSNGYNQTFTQKERLFYLGTVLNGDAENFFGNVITNLGYTINFQLTGVDLTPGDRTLTVSLQGYSLTSHSVQIRLNDNVVGPNAVGSVNNRYSRTYTIPSSYLKEGNNNLTMSSGLQSDTSLFDFVSIDYARAYKAINDRLDFYTETKKDTVVSGFSTPNVRLFDVTYDGELTEYVNNTIVQTNGTYGPVIPASRSRRYYATAAGNVAFPISVLPNDPALLGSPSNGATMVIIAHSSLMPEAKAWRDYRLSQGTSAIVVDVEEIFDEFNYGVSSSLSIRSFLNYAKNNWQTPPGYVLLIGDASYDPRNYQGTGEWNMVPTRMVNTLFEETGSDEALADFNNDGLAEIPIGRIASRTGAGVTNVLNKTVTWETNLTPTALADRGALFAYDVNAGYLFDEMSARVMAKLPANVPKATVQRNTANESTGKAAIVNAFNSGKYIANYTGHGSSAAWASQNFFWSGDFANLTNSNTPTIITALTCLNGYFVPAANNDSFAEAVTKASNGGAVAIWASTGRTTPDVQEVMALRFYEQLAAGNITRLGDLINDAKAQLIGGGDVRRSWALIGDPMLRLR